MPNIRKPFSPTSNKYYLYNTTCNLPPPPQMFVFSKQTFEFYFRNCFWFNWNIQKCKQSFLQVDEKYFDIILVIFKIILHKVNFNLNTFKLHYATIFKTFGIEESREFLCTLQAHYVFCMHLWDVIIHIWSYFKYPSTIIPASISLHFRFFIS